MVGKAAQPESVDEPILRRLAKLQGQYGEFIADAAARVLLWKFADDEKRMLEVFVQHNAVTAESGDAILEELSPFVVRAEHGIVIVYDLSEVMDQIAAAMKDQGAPNPEWFPPKPPTSLERRRSGPPPDQEYLVKALRSLFEHMQPQAKHLTLVLKPRKIDNSAEWLAWLAELIPQLDDEKVRLILPHDGTDPTLLALGARYKPRVMTAEAALDMPAAYEEIALKTPDLNQPAGQFRLQFIRIGKAVGNKDLAGARANAVPAVAIAQTAGWPHLEFAALQALATGELGLGDPNAAMLSYTKAGDAASRAVAGGAEWAESLVLQSRLGMGAVAVTMGAWPLGAKLYGEQALPIAVKTQDKLMQLDCLRMAAYCEERGGTLDPAWQHLTQALGVGRELPQEQREASTLAFVGQAMLRICQTERYNSHRYGVDQQMVELMGRDWQSKAAPQSQPPPGTGGPSPLENAPPPPGLPTAPAEPPKGQPS